MRYRALVGMNYPGRRGEVRVEAGEVAEGLPRDAVARLLEQGYIEPVKEDEDGPQPR